MSAVTVKKDSCDVKIEVDVFVPYWDVRTFPFTFSCGGNEAYAGLLTRLIKERLASLVRNARAEAYEQGYKDAKAKRAKCEWFSEQL